MWWRRKRDVEAAPAFHLEPGDSIYAILACEPVRFPGNPKTTTLTFCAILRGDGSAEVVSVIESTRRGRITERHVQTKRGIPPDRIEEELAVVRDGFTAIIWATSGHRLAWHRLDLADVQGRDEQIRRIREWGRAPLVPL